MKELTYADIRKMALEHGIKDTRLHIGLWATDRYVKKRKMIQGKTYTIYLNPEKPDVPLNKNDAFQKVQKRRVQEKR